MNIRVKPIDRMTRAALLVATRMRQEDVDELWALSRTKPVAAVRASIRVSTEAYVAYVGEEPVAVFGVSAPVIGGYGVPWFLGTRGVDGHETTYFRMARRFIAHLLTKCDTLENMADARNRRTLVFLSRLGFAMSEPFRVPSGAYAIMFKKEAGRNV